MRASTIEHGAGRSFESQVRIAGDSVDPPMHNRSGYDAMAFPGLPAAATAVATPGRGQHDAAAASLSIVPRSHVGILDRLERALERVFNGAFARTFRSGLQPVEIIAALKREMDTTAAIVSRDRILVPNRFHVNVGPRDYGRLSALGDGLRSELVSGVEQYAIQQHYQFAGGLDVELLEDDTLGEGELRIDSRTAQGRVEWTPMLELDGRRIPMSRGAWIIGRGQDCAITLDDTGASRHHAEFVWDGRRAGIRDLGSTNGTKVNGRRVSQVALEPDSVIQIGRAQLVFRIVPRAVDDEPGSRPREEQRR